MSFSGLRLLLVGGSGSLSYQWYLDGSAVGSNIATYSYAAAYPVLMRFTLT